MIQKIKTRVFQIIAWLFAWCMVPVLCIFCYSYQKFARRHTLPRLMWGPIPIINYKYWSSAMQQLGLYSKTFVMDKYDMCKRSDFDLYAEDVWKPPYSKIPFFRHLLKPYGCFIYSILSFDIFHFSFEGGFLQFSPIGHLEPFFLKLAGKKVVVIPYGGDAFQYSRIHDFVLRHGLLCSYPHSAREEEKICKRLNRWVRYADILITTFMMDGVGRWDVLTPNILAIDTNEWLPKKIYSTNDGKNGPVTIVHAPNHRGFKGTEFIIHAIEELQKEGWDIRLLVLEKKSNEEVKRILHEEADIVVDQLVMCGYGLYAIEGMSSGLPVIVNLENENYTNLFRIYTHLNECPLVSSSCSRLKQDLIHLMTHPDLRKQIGMAARQYVEKYHSLKTAQYVFEKIYNKIWHGNDVDIMNLFHPLKSSYNCFSPKIIPPLHNNRLVYGSKS